MQLNYQHYSFDLWETLLKSNPDFRKKRAAYFSKCYNPYNYSTETVEEFISEISRQCDTVNQVVGGNIDALEMYAMVLHKLQNDLSEWNLHDIQKLYNDIEMIFLQNPPMMYSDETTECLREIVKAGKTFSVLSNTGFVKGSTIRKSIAFSLIGISKFMIFSDEIKASKPSFKAFYEMLNNIPGGFAKFKNIIHIGDNPLADGEGARNAGLAAGIINSNHLTIKDVL